MYEQDFYEDSVNQSLKTPLSTHQDSQLENTDTLYTDDDLVDLQEEIQEMNPVCLEPENFGGANHRYLDQPYLSLEEEQRLAMMYYTYQEKKQASQGDALFSAEEEKMALFAAHKLVMSHMRYVVKVAKKYLSYGLPLPDLIQEGAVGLMKAVQHFNPFKGVRLVSFSVQWIKSEIHNYIIRNWKLVKIATTKAHRKLFFNLRKLQAQQEYQNMTKTEQFEKIATTLDVEIADVEHMSGRFQEQELSLQAPVFLENPDAPLLEETLGSAIDTMEHQIHTLEIENVYHQKIAQSLHTLSPREAYIIEQRYLKEEAQTLKELADLYGISVERVRQIEKKALSSLKNHLAELE